MSNQIKDTCYFRDNTCYIIDFTNPVTFYPEKYGFQPGTHNSGCWRGFWCEYKISQSRIFLDNLNIYQSKKEFPIFCNSTPEIDGSGFAKYSNVDLFIDYSGKIVLGCNQQSKTYTSVSWEEQYTFKTVYELVFDHGVIVDWIDHSAELNKIDGFPANDYSLYMSQLREVIP